MSSPDLDAGASWLGRRLSLQIGPVAHGGHCVARHQGRVVFVRHCLPGETVLAEVTEDRGGSFCRADAIEVHTASADRVAPPCSYARPGGCGGCDFQHVSLAGQRALKAAVVSEQLRRLAGIDRSITVQALANPGVEDGLGWRRRIRFAVTADGRLGLHAHRSDQVLPIDECPIGAPGVAEAPALGRRWFGLTAVEVAVDDDAAVATVGYRAIGARPGRRGARQQLRADHLDGPAMLTYRVAGRSFQVAATSFWQTHPGAAEAFTAAVLAAAEPAPGEQALDLYAGSGLFTAALADRVGATGRVFGLEGDRVAVQAAATNLTDRPWAAVRQAAVTGASVRSAAGELAGPVAITVLDPPRSGAGAQLMQAVLAITGRVVIYVACDPAALARDLATATEAGWLLSDIAAIDAFPMTHHIECVAVLRRGEPVG